MGSHLSLVSNILIYCLVFSFKTVLIAQGPNALKANDPIQTLIDNMVHVQGGTFTMGCTSEQRRYCKEWEKPTHHITVSDFYIARFEVTQELWLSVMKSDTLREHNKDCIQCPVEGVSWEDTQEFIQKLNSVTGLGFRLPTEAEWEYAARGGSKTRGYIYSGSNNLNDVARYGGMAKRGDPDEGQITTYPVGGKEPNELGLYDMSGNVWEWCDDWFKGYPGSHNIWDFTGNQRIIRGGSWYNLEGQCRVTARANGNPHNSYNLQDGCNNLGFRLASSSMSGQLPTD